MRKKNFVLRLLCIPFICGLVAMACIWKFLNVIYHYLLFGGELVTYMKNDDVKMMADVYHFAKQKMLDEKDKQS